MKNHLAVLSVAWLCLSVTTVVAQAPPGSPDCWKCQTKFCHDEEFTTECPIKPCEWDWVLDPNNPDIKERKYFCRLNRQLHLAEIVNGDATYNHCVQNGAGYIQKGHHETDVVCTYIYECICNGDHNCIQGNFLRHGVIRKNHAFASTRFQVCQYVEATPGMDD